MYHRYFFFQPPDAVMYLNSPSIYGSVNWQCVSKANSNKGKGKLCTRPICFYDFSLRIKCHACD